MKAIFYSNKGSRQAFQKAFLSVSVTSLVLYLFATSSLLAQTTKTWNGGSTTDNIWSDGANWGGTAPVSGNALIFSGTVRQTNTNDIGGLSSLGLVTFGTSGWNISGNAVSMASGFSDNGSGGTNIWDLNTTLNSTASIDNNADVLMFPGVLSGTGGITTAGSGTVILAGNNSYTGETVINGGRVQLGDGGATGNAGSGTITIATGGSEQNNITLGLAINETGSPVFPNSLLFPSGQQAGIYVSAGQTAVFTNSIGGAGQLWVNGPGRLVISNSLNPYTGGTVLYRAGALQVDILSPDGTTASALGNGGIYMAGGTLIYAGSSATTMGQIGPYCLQGGTNVVSIANSATILTNGSAISGGGVFVKAGPGTLALSAANGYDAITVVSNGTLALVGSGSIANSSTIAIASNAVFDVSALSTFTTSQAIYTLGGAGSINGNVSTLSSASIAPGGAGVVGTLTFNNNLTINGTPLSFHLSPNPSTGNDLVHVLGNLENDGESLITLNYGLLSQGTYTLLTYNSLSGSGTFTLNGSYPNVTLNTGATALTLIVGSGGSRNSAGLLWKGDGIANNWDVLTTTNWLNFGVPDVFHQGDDVTFDDTGSSTPAVDLTTTLTPASVTVANSSDHNYTFSGNGQLSGTMSLTKSGSGTLTLADNNSYTGETVINGGMLQLGNGGTEGSLDPSSLVTFSGGTGNFLSFNRSDDPSFPNNISILSGSRANVSTAPGQTVTLTGAISDVTAGNGEFWAGPGTVIVSPNAGDADQTTSIVIVSNGVLSLSDFTTSTLGSGSFYISPSGGTLQYTGSGETTARIPAGNFMQSPTNNVLEIVNPSANLTVSSALGGTAAGDPLIKTGPGTLTLSAVCTYAGDTTIGNGTLALTGAGALEDSVSINIASNATFDVSGVTGTYYCTSVIDGGGSVNGDIIAAAKIAPGVIWPKSMLTFNNSLTFTNGASLVLDLGPTASESNDFVQVLGAVNIHGTVPVTLNYLTGSLSPGTYTLMTYSSLAGSGTFVLNAAYPNVTLNVGASALTLTVGSGGSTYNVLTWMGDGIANNWDVQTTTNWLNSGIPDVFHQGDGVTFNDSGSSTPAIDLTTTLTPASVTVANSSDHNYTFSGSGQLSGAMSLIKSGTGTLTLAGDNSYTGETVINGGRVQLGDGGAAGNAGSGTITIATGGSEQNNITLGLAINETGSPVFPNSLLFPSGQQAGIYVSTGQTAVFTNSISGAGQLWVNGPGRLVISNSLNPYTGGTVLYRAGALEVDTLSPDGTTASALGNGGIYMAGGTLIYAGSSATTMGQIGPYCLQGGTNVVSIANSATILTNGSAISGGGVFVKAGPGTLALSAANGYDATTVVSNGTLALVGSGSIANSPTIAIASNAVFDVSGVASPLTIKQIIGGSGSVNGDVIGAAEIAPGIIRPGSTLTFSNSLTFTNGASVVLGLSPSVSGSNDLVRVLGPINIHGTVPVTLNYLTGSVSAGTYTLMTYSSTTGSGTFALSAAYPNVTLNIGATALTLTVGAGGSTHNTLTWRGDGIANNWDVQTATNWLNSGVPDVFHQGDSVTFDDTGSSVPDIDLTTTLAPASVMVNNSSSHNYIFSGNGQLNGAMGLTKSGNGTLTLAGNNTFSGKTVINNGTLQLGDGGTAGSAGTNGIYFTADETKLVINRSDTPTITSRVILGGSGNNNGKNYIAVASGTSATLSGGISNPAVEQLFINDTANDGTLIINSAPDKYSSSANSVVLVKGALQMADLSNGGSPSPLGVGGYYIGSGGSCTLRYDGPSATCDRFGGGCLQGSGTDAFDVVNPSTTLTISSSIGEYGSVTSFLKTGAGTLTLSGSANNYGAPTIVEQGVLLANGSIGNSTITVLSSAAFGGSGVVNAVTVQGGGTIQGGDANLSGTLTVALGPLNLGPTNGSPATTFSRFEIASGGTVEADAGLNVNGTNIVNITDSNLLVGTYTLINYATINYGASGAFQLGTLPAGVIANLQDSGSSIQLVVTAVNAVPPSLEGIASLPDGNYALTFSGSDGAGYSVLASTNIALPLADWTKLTMGTFGSEPVTFDDLTATNYSQRFYIITTP